MKPIWTATEIEEFCEVFQIGATGTLYEGAENYHFPDRDFLSDGYAPLGGYVKDFCIIPHNGRWHLFHITGYPGQRCWVSGNEMSFGHASTSDFRHWIRHLMPLAISERSWERVHIWAPYVYRHEDLFYMFYMGSGGGESLISYAVSPDLEQWTRWDDGPIRSAVGRDPFVYNNDGQTVLLYTGLGCGKISACVSDDLVHWQPKPDLINIPGRVAAESPSMHKLDDRYVLWFNDYQYQGHGFRAAYVFSDDPWHFDPDQIQTFEFRTDLPEVEPSRELRVETPTPVSIELLACENDRAFVAYFRWQGDRNRLFFGELDWSKSPAEICEISSPQQLWDLPLDEGNKHV